MQQASKAPQKKESRLPATGDSESLPGSADTLQHPLHQKIAGSDGVSGQQQKINTLQQSIQRKENRTGIPDNLKSGLENLSGYDLSHVKVHFNSSQPAQLNALAYAKGSDIHLGPGQQKHLPHEAWHVVQQMQNRVKPTTQLKTGIAINDDTGLEKEADRMGNRALSPNTLSLNKNSTSPYATPGPVVQRLVGFELETSVPLTPGETEPALQKDKPLLRGIGWSLTVEVADDKRVVEFKVRAIDDQSDPAQLEATMTDLEKCTNIIATAAKPLTITELSQLTGAKIEDEKFKNTTITPIGDPITARPQMTAGISLEKITNVLADLATKESQLMLGTKKWAGKDAFQGKQQKTNTIAEKYFSALPGAQVSKTYQGFISLMAQYINAAQVSGPPPYFKAVVPALSRANLGEYMKIPEVSTRKNVVLKDLTAYAGVKESDLLFPNGVMEKGQLIKDPATIKSWVESILKGEDGIPWSTQVNQKGDKFTMEDVGPAGPGGKKASGIPIEFRTLQYEIPHFAWKPYALHLFKYAKSINTDKNPAPYKNLDEDTLTKRPAPRAVAAPKEPFERKAEGPPPKKEPPAAKKPEPVVAKAPITTPSDHDERVTQATDFLARAIDKLKPEQTQWLQSHPWSTDPKDSALVSGILAIPKDWKNPEHQLRVEKITAYLLKEGEKLVGDEEKWILAHNKWTARASESFAVVVHFKIPLR